MHTLVRRLRYRLHEAGDPEYKGEVAGYMVCILLNTRDRVQLTRYTS